MDSIHFQFVSTPPGLDSYTVERFFELLDAFEAKPRDLILRAAYHCFDLGNSDGYSSEAYREEMYRDFKRVFSEHSRSFAKDDDMRWREAYVIYGLVSYLLIEAMRNSDRGIYESFYHGNLANLKQFNEARNGDDSAREKAASWSTKAIDQLGKTYFAKVSQRVAYSTFCKQVVKPLIEALEEV